MIQIGGVYTTFWQEEGILVQKYRDRNGRCIAILFKVSGSGIDWILLISLKHDYRNQGQSGGPEKRTNSIHIKAVPRVLGAEILNS